MASPDVDRRVNQLKHDVEDVYVLLNQTNQKVTQLERTATTRLDRLDNRLDGVENRLGGVENRLDGVETRLDGVENRLGGIDNRLGGVEIRLGGVEIRLDRFEQRLDGMEVTQQSHGQMLETILDLLRGQPATR